MKFFFLNLYVIHLNSMKNIIIFLFSVLNKSMAMEHKKNKSHQAPIELKKSYVQTKYTDKSQRKRLRKKNNIRYNRFTNKQLNLINDFNNLLVFDAFYEEISQKNSQNNFFYNVEQIHNCIKGRDNAYIKEKIKHTIFLYNIVRNVFLKMIPKEKDNFIEIIKHLRRISFKNLNAITPMKKKFFFKILSIHIRNLRLLNEEKSYVQKYSIKDEVSLIKLDHFLISNMPINQLTIHIEKIIEKIQPITNKSYSISLQKE